MKKFLLIVLLESNLYGMNTPFSQLTLSVETALRMAKEFFESEEQTAVGATAVLNAVRSVRECYGRSISKELKTIVSFMEFYALTRELTPLEKQNAVGLFRLFPFVDEIRVFDSKSFIDGSLMTKNLRDHFRSSKACAEFDFAESYIDCYNENLARNPLMSKLLTNMVRNFAEISPAFFELLLTHIVHRSNGNLGYLSEALWLCSSGPQNFLPGIFLSKSYSMANPRGICINLSNTRTIYISPFPGANTVVQPLKGAYGAKFGVKHLFYHEFGHNLCPLMCFLAGSDFDETIERIAPLLIDYEVSEEDIQSLRQEWKNPQIRLKYLNGLESLGFDIPSSFEEAVKIFKSPRFRASLLTNAIEIFQMFGSFLANTGEKRILFINNINDLRLSAELGTSIRITHTGFTPSNVKYNILPVYGAFLEFWGMSLEGYVTKTMYPQGLCPLLQMEYRLMSPIWKEQIIQSIMLDFTLAICYGPEIPRIKFFQKSFSNFAIVD